MILRYIFMFYFPSGSSQVRGTFAACCTVDALNSLASDKDCHSVFADLPAVDTTDGPIENGSHETLMCCN